MVNVIFAECIRGKCNHVFRQCLAPYYFMLSPRLPFSSPVIRSVTSCYKLRSDLIQFCAATKYILRVVFVVLEGKLLMSRHAWNISVHEKAREFFAGSPKPFADEFIHSLEECGEFRVGEER